jgi:hypothetical protein
VASVLIGFALATPIGCGSGTSGGRSGLGGSGNLATGGSASGGRSGGAGLGGSGPPGGSSPAGGAGNSGAVGTGGVSASDGGVGGSVGMGGGPAVNGQGVGGSAGGQPGTSTGGQAGAAAIGDLDEIYEAEAIPPNQIFGYAKVAKCTPMCTKPLTVGDNCCSAGGQVTWIVSANGSAHPAGWMQFNEISAPADASYDVTFWYHCGDSDVWGDCDCGGQTMTEPKQTGCRPHLFTVNGTLLPGGYHFPCFPGSWNTLYAATVSLPLTKGENTIMVSSPDPRDSTDLDAIEIVPPGKGHAPLIAPNTKDPLGHRLTPTPSWCTSAPSW